MNHSLTEDELDRMFYKKLRDLQKFMFEHPVLEPSLHAAIEYALEDLKKRAGKRFYENYE